MAGRLAIKRFCLGDWATNCYVVRVDKGDGEEGAGVCWMVDVGYGPGGMIRYVQEQGLALEAVVLTHGHVDHIAGLADVRGVWPEVPILIHEAEQRFLTEPMLNLSVVLEEPVVAPAATQLLRDGQVLELGGVGFEVLHTPGHSPGGVALYQAQAGEALVGDTLFAGGVGRSDFPTSDPAALVRSIRERLYMLPDETRVRPGHGAQTTIGQEKRSNPFVRA